MPDVEFEANGGTAKGYLAEPEGEGPGLVVLGEWWGLDDNVKGIVDSFAKEGFVTVAPDLYGGNTTEEPDEAQKQLMAMNMEEAEKEMRGAVKFVLDHPKCNGEVGSSIYFALGVVALHTSTLLNGYHFVFHLWPPICLAAAPALTRTFDRLRSRPRNARLGSVSFPAPSDPFGGDAGGDGRPASECASCPRRGTRRSAGPGPQAPGQWDQRPTAPSHGRPLRRRSWRASPGRPPRSRSGRPAGGPR